MGQLTAEKELLRSKLNLMAQQEYEAKREKAVQSGRPLPAPPVPLEAADIEYPKFLHKDWKSSDQAPGLYVPGQSKLVKSAEDEAALIAKGWTDSAPAGKVKEPELDETEPEGKPSKKGK